MKVRAIYRSSYHTGGFLIEKEFNGIIKYSWHCGTVGTSLQRRLDLGIESRMYHIKDNMRQDVFHHPMKRLSTLQLVLMGLRI